MTTAGAINGKMRAKVEAKTIARTHAPIAKEGLYVLGYTAEHQKLVDVIPHFSYIHYLENVAVASQLVFPQRELATNERVAKGDMPEK